MKLSIRGKIALLTGAMVFLAVMTGIMTVQIYHLQKENHELRSVVEKHGAYITKMSAESHQVGE